MLSMFECALISRVWFLLCSTQHIHTTCACHSMQGINIRGQSKLLCAHIHTHYMRSKNRIHVLSAAAAKVPAAAAKVHVMWKQHCKATHRNTTSAPCLNASRFRHPANHQVQATAPSLRRRRFGLKIHANGHEHEKKLRKKTQKKPRT